MDMAIKRKRYWIVGSLLVLSIAILAVYFASPLSMPKDIATQMREAAEEMNTQLPMPIDGFMRLDKVSARGDTDFIYHYTLVAMQSIEHAKDTIDNHIKHTIVETLKSSPSLAFFRDNLITMGYQYYDSDGKLVARVAVTPEMYAQ